MNCIFIQKTRFGFKSHNRVLCLHTEVTNWAPYASHMHQMKQRYTGYIYRNTRTSCSIHKRSHISIFFFVVSYSAEDQIFTTENFPRNTICFVHAIKRPHNSGLESLWNICILKYHVKRKTSIGLWYIIWSSAFKTFSYSRAHCERYRNVITTLIIDKENNTNTRSHKTQLPVSQFLKPTRSLQFAHTPKVCPSRHSHKHTDAY
jgi:hypothetical protein